MSSPIPAQFRDWAAVARPRLRRTAYLLCGDWHLAEDLTQETLVRVYSVWHRVSVGGPPDGYATRTLVNAHRAVLRRPWRRESAMEHLPEQGVIAVTAVDERDALLAALAKLGPSQRAIVVLRYWEDRSIEDVANLLGLSTGTVKSQSARGLTHLRRLLGEPADAEASDPDPGPPPLPQPQPQPQPQREPASRAQPLRLGGSRPTLLVNGEPT